jgi:hypothetical protein
LIGSVLSQDQLLLGLANVLIDGLNQSLCGTGIAGCGAGISEVTFRLAPKGKRGEGLLHEKGERPTKRRKILLWSEVPQHHHAHGFPVEVVFKLMQDVHLLPPGSP